VVFPVENVFQIGFQNVTYSQIVIKSTKCFLIEEHKLFSKKMFKLRIP